MNIDLWQAALAVVSASGMVGLGCRWWYGRQLHSVTHRLTKLDSTHQSAMRMMSQARKQVDDLQRLVSEYRRKLTTMELARRRQDVKAIAEPEAPAAPPAALPAVRLQGSWADTQPM